MTNETILEILMNSEKRKKILLFLMDGKKTIEEIKNLFQIRSSPIMVQVKILVKKKIIEEKNGFFELTELGKILIPEMKQVIQLFKTIENQYKYWSNMNIESIPTFLIDRLNEIGEPTLIIQDKTYIFECPNEILFKLKQASLIMEVSCIFKNIYIKEYMLLAENNIPIVFIFTKNIIKRFEIEFPQIYYKYIKMDNIRFFTTEEIQIASCTVTDIFMSLSLFTSEGYYINHNLISLEKSALKWGQDLFGYYRNLAEVNKITLD